VKHKNPSNLYCIIRGLLFILLWLAAAQSISFATLSNVADHAAPHKLFRPTMNAEHLPVVKEPVKSLTIEQMEEIRTLFKDERFGALSVMMDKYQSAFEADPADEFLINGFLKMFAGADPDYERLLLKWKETFPYNYQPYLALAQYYYSQGWESRGSRFAAETSSEQFQQMEDCFQKAEENIEKALKMKPKLMPAYCMLISMYDASRPEQEENVLIQRALELFPHSFLVWSKCIIAKKPRWGGSYDQMQSLAKAAEQFSKANPNLTKLYGFIYADQSWYLKQAKQYSKAIDLLRDALAFGERSSLHQEIAEIYYYNLEDYPQALEECNEAIRFGLSAEYYLLRSKIYYKLEDYERSLNDLETANRVYPFYDESKEWAQWAGRDLMLQGHKKYKAQHVRAAIGLFNLSLKFNDRDYETFHWRGKAFFDKGDAGSALKDFEQALALNPRDFHSISMIDYIANSERQFDYSIGYWDRFLKLEPKHDKAYLGRARAYYYKGDFGSCLKDLNQSCRLGNREACSRINNIKTKGQF
jgi:tetratricopeptide (TPR) repeat protein